MSQYIYIGKFFHRNGKNLNLLEKKIGKTTDLKKREFDLNRTKSPIGYTMVAAWDTGDATSNMEQKLHAILAHDNSHGEWFEDDDDDLVARMAKYMELEGYQQVALGEDEDDVDANQARKEENKKSQKARNREKYADHLLDIHFETTYLGQLFSVVMRGEGRYYCEQTDKEYKSLNACKNAGKEVVGQAISRNLWTDLRNSDRKSPDDILQEIADREKAENESSQ